MRNLIGLIFLLSVSVLPVSTLLAGGERAHARLFSTEGSFEDVSAFVNDAIVNRGLVVDYISHVAEMLNRTAADVGATKTVYRAAQTLQFCSAVFSRATMEADPTNLAFCPYGIFIYELQDQPGTVYVGYRPLSSNGNDASNQALADVNKLLETIIKEAIE